MDSTGTLKNVPCVLYVCVGVVMGVVGVLTPALSPVHSTTPSLTSSGWPGRCRSTAMMRSTPSTCRHIDTTDGETERGKEGEKKEDKGEMEGG
jgi:hypothetical protein